MAFTRKMLKAMGIEDEKIDQIIEAHAETVDALKEQRDEFKDSANQLAEVQKKLTDAERRLAEQNPDADREAYEKLKQEFDDYKAGISAKEVLSKKTGAYRKLLEGAGLKGEKLLDTIIKSADFDGMELDEHGTLKDAEKLEESLKAEWKDYISTPNVKGAKTATPPTSGTRTFTIDEIKTMSPSEINQNFEAIKASLKKGT